MKCYVLKYFLLLIGNYSKKIHKKIYMKNIGIACLTLVLLNYFSTNLFGTTEEDSTSIQWTCQDDSQTITDNYKFKKITLKKIFTGDIYSSKNFNDLEIPSLFSADTTNISDMHFYITRNIDQDSSQTGICLGKWSQQDSDKITQHKNLIKVTDDNKFYYYIYDSQFDFLTNTLTISIIVDGKYLNSKSSETEPIINTKQYNYNIAEDKVPANYISTSPIS